MIQIFVANHFHMNENYFNAIDSFNTVNGRKPSAIIISQNEFNRIIKDFGTLRPIQGFTICDVHTMSSDEIKDGECDLIP